MKGIRHIGLLTDFGMKDAYVSEMKGVIYSALPDAVVIDLSHEISPQCVVEGALFLERFWEYWHIPLIVIAVVDPGVGSERRILIGRDKHKLLICPDNGLGTFVFQRKHVEVRCLRKVDLDWERVSKTFHGRDIMAPLAVQIANGYDLEKLGPLVEDWVRIRIREPKLEKDLLLGEVLYFDRFGNAVTNIRREDVGIRKMEFIRIKGKWGKIPFVETYSDVDTGSALGLWGSSNRLEIAVNCGSCKDKFRLKVGARIEVYLGTN